eukprot:7387634-Prymnesium_polylepis.1
MEAHRHTHLPHALLCWTDNIAAHAMQDIDSATTMLNKSIFAFVDQTVPDIEVARQRRWRKRCRWRRGGARGWSCGRRGVGSASAVAAHGAAL